MPRKMHVMLGETKLEAYIRNRTLELMKIKKISIYKVAQDCPFMSQSGIYKCLNGEHKPSIQFLEAVCTLMHVTLEEFFADYDSTCYVQEEEKVMVIEEENIHEEPKGAKCHEHAN